jgi:hydrogenase nickel incorporation protein HypA/HybF
MHEAGIVSEMLQSAEQAAARAGCRTIRHIVLQVGALSSAVPEALQFAFEALKPATAAAHATLEIERVRPVAFCASCQREFPVEDLVALCPACGAPSADIRRGLELVLLRLEAE